MRRTFVAWVMLAGCDWSSVSEKGGNEPAVTAERKHDASVKTAAKSATETKTAPDAEEETPEVYGQMSKPPPPVEAPPEPEPEPEPESEPEPEPDADTGTMRERPSTEFPEPTEEELAAWDRKDPAAEKHLYTWDKDNYETIDDLWEDLACMRAQLMLAGEKAFGAKKGSPEDEDWFAFKRDFILRADRWQQRMFAANPRLLEKSKFAGWILELHELLMSSYPRAYNDADRKAIDEADAQWEVVAAKAEEYTKTLGHDWPDFEADEAAVRDHRKRCEALAAVK
mgnify:CR=1 FL=1